MSSTALKSLENAVGDSLSAIADLQEALHRYSDIASLQPEDLIRALAWANSLRSLRDIVCLQVMATCNRVVG